MNHKIRYSPAAEQDFYDIWDRYCETVSRASAEKIVTSLQNAAQSLSQYPESCEALPYTTFTGARYRFKVCGSYLIFYRHDEENIYIDRILYARRDYMKLLFE